MTPRTNNMKGKYSIDDAITVIEYYELISELIRDKWLIDFQSHSFTISDPNGPESYTGRTLDIALKNYMDRDKK